MQFQHYKWNILWCKSWYTWECSQYFAWKYTRKTQIAPPIVTEIANDRVYGTHLRMSSKMLLRVQMNVKFGQLKNEDKTKIFSAPGDAQESANGTTINVFDVSLMVKFRVHLIIHLELHLKVHFKIYKKVHKTLHPRLHLKVHFRLHLSCTCLSNCQCIRVYNMIQ